MQWSNDKELFGQMRDVLYSAVIGDILDKMHYYHQFLPWRIQPLDKNMVVAGRAMTVLEADAFEDVSDSHNPVMNNPFGLMLEALDDIKEDEADVYPYADSGGGGSCGKCIPPRYQGN